MIAHNVEIETSRAVIDRAYSLESVFRSQLVLSRMAFDGKRDQPVDQLCIWNSRRLPQFRIHADGGKSRKRVDLIDVELSCHALQKQIDASHARTFEDFESSNGQPLGIIRLNRLERRGNQQARVVIDVLRVVIVELAGGNNLSGQRRNRIVVTKNADLDLASIDSPLDDDLAIVLRRSFQGSRQFFGGVYFRDSDGGPKVGGLDKHGIRKIAD